MRNHLTCDRLQILTQIYLAIALIPPHILRNKRSIDRQPIVFSFRREDGIGEEALTLRTVRKGRSSTTDRRSLHQSDRSSRRTDEGARMLREGRSSDPLVVRVLECVKLEGKSLELFLW